MDTNNKKNQTKAEDETKSVDELQRTRKHINSAAGETLVAVYENPPKGYEGTCLRPLGLCDLGGCCDSCWYRPNHPRHKQSADS